MGRAFVDGVSDAIRKDQPALGVGVDDLDGLAARAGDDVAGFDRLARRHVLGGGDDPDDIDLRLQLGDRQHRADHGCSPAHVGFHHLHVLGGLDRDAAAVEGDAFPDQRQQRATSATTRIAEDDHLRRFLGAARHRQQRAHLEPAHVVHIEHLEVEPGPLHRLPDLVGKDPRSKGVRRRVDPFPDAVGGVRERNRVFQRLRRALVAVQPNDAERIDLGDGVVMVRLQRSNVEIAEADALGGGPRQIGGRRPRRHGFWQDDGNLPMPTLAQYPPGRLQHIPQAHHIELVRLTDADQDRPLAGHGVEVVDRHQFHELAAEFPIFEQLPDGALQRLVERLGLGWHGRLAFKDRQDEGVRLRLFRGGGQQPCLHASSCARPRKTSVLYVPRLRSLRTSLAGLPLLKPAFHFLDVCFGVAIPTKLVLAAGGHDAKPDPGRDRRRRDAEPFSRLRDGVQPLFGYASSRLTNGRRLAEAGQGLSGQLDCLGIFHVRHVEDHAVKARVEEFLHLLAHPLGAAHNVPEAHPLRVDAGHLHPALERPLGLRIRAADDQASESGLDDGVRITTDGLAVTLQNVQLVPNRRHIAEEVAHVGVLRDQLEGALLTAAADQDRRAVRLHRSRHV